MFPWILLITLNIADVLLTKNALGSGLIEANPIADFVIVNYGFIGLLAFKLSFIMFFFAASSMSANEKLKNSGLLLLNVVYSLLLIYHILLLTNA